MAPHNTFPNLNPCVMRTIIRFRIVAVTWREEGAHNAFLMILKFDENVLFKPKPNVIR